jgi:hypothetical protein
VDDFGIGPAVRMYLQQWCGLKVPPRTSAIEAISGALGRIQGQTAGEWSHCRSGHISINFPLFDPRDSAIRSPGSGTAPLVDSARPKSVRLVITQPLPMRIAFAPSCLGSKKNGPANERSQVGEEVDVRRCLSTDAAR